MDAAPAEPPRSSRVAEVSLVELAREFAFIGATGFGGNLGLLVHRRIVTRRAWMDEAEFALATEAAAIAPGGTSTALLAEVGRRLRGARGVAVAMGASLTPGTLFVIAMLSLYERHAGDRWVQGLLQGAAAGAVAVLIVFLIRVWQVFGSSWIDVAGGALVLVAALVLPVFIVLVVGIAVGYAVVTVHERRHPLDPSPGPPAGGGIVPEEPER